MKAKRAHSPKAQTPPKDRLFLSQTIKFILKRVKTAPTSNKKTQTRRNYLYPILRSYLVEHRGFELLIGVAVWSFLVLFATVLLVKML